MAAGTTGTWTWEELRAERVVYEDDAVVALDKPAGISVTGERHDTDVVELAGEAGEPLWPVHRIDKVTSGLVLLARSVAAHGPLTRQFNRRTVAKTYLALTPTTGLPARGTIDLPLTVGRKSRVRIAARRDAIRYAADAGRWSVPQASVHGDRVYPAVTTFARVAQSETHTALVVRPVSGRRHQIRVHLAWIGHAIEGDPLFEKSPTSARTHLHSWRLSFDAAGGDRLDLAADPDDGFWAPFAGAPPSRLWRASVARLADLDELVVAADLPDSPDDQE
jgi:tRNA pseudouridine32 synthase/23S rRNA pseudouridine746 synthase/23S rRNA pseudouridine1911/1915/1917 synthase